MLEVIRRLLRRIAAAVRAHGPRPTALLLLPLAAGLVAAALPPRPVPVLFPAGTVLPIRFLHGLTGGRDRVGAPVLVQTMGALVQDSCVVVEPFTHVTGHVLDSRAGGRLGRPGHLAVMFDSLEVSPRQWVAIDAVVDSVEYAAPGALSDSGELAGGRRPTRGRYVRAGAVIGAGALFDLETGVIPVALLEGWRLLRSGPRARILAGEVASVRLTRPLKLLRASTCIATSTHEDLTRVPSLPYFVPRTEDDRAGRHAGDPINLVLLGTGAQIDSAFRHAGWVRAQAPSLRSLARGVTAAVVERSAVGAPVSTQYFEGRKQDLAYELAGPNARIRHHVRLWLLDDTTQTWVGAADQDIGLVVNPFHRTATHRIAPDVDVERDQVVRELEATACGTLLSYLELPDAVRAARNASGQKFTTDGRAAALRLKSCS